MSKYGMLGLLEGVGQGMQGTGKAMTVNALAAAEDQRKANREKVRREWMEGQDQKKYDRNRADQLTDQGTAITQEQTTHDRNRAETVADQGTAITQEQTTHDRDRAEQVADQDKAFDNRAPSAYAEKAAIIDADKTLTPAEKKTAKYGLTLGSNLTAKELSKVTTDAYKQAEKEAAQMLQLPSEDRPAWIDNRAGELVKKFAPGSGGGGLLETDTVPLHPKEAANIAKQMVGAGYNPAKDKESQIKKLQAANYSKNDIDNVIKLADQGVADKTKADASVVPLKTVIERKVEYQITMGDTRDPKVIADEIQQSEYTEAQKNKVGFNAVETLDSLPPRVKQAVERQAQGVFEQEQGKRPLEVIIKAILNERSRGN